MHHFCRYLVLLWTWRARGSYVAFAWRNIWQTLTIPTIQSFHDSQKDQIRASKSSMETIHTISLKLQKRAITFQVDNRVRKKSYGSHPCIHSRVFMRPPPPPTHTHTHARTHARARAHTHTHTHTHTVRFNRYSVMIIRHKTTSTTSTNCLLSHIVQA